MSAARLAYGLRETPAVTAAWGARMIFPCDVVPDRVDTFGDDDAKAALLDWLNSCAPNPNGNRFLDAVTGSTTPRDSHVFTVYEDETGIVRASAQGSGGYLYVSAWLKAHVSDDGAQEDEEPDRDQVRAEATFRDPDGNHVETVRGTANAVGAQAAWFIAAQTADGLACTVEASPCADAADDDELVEYTVVGLYEDNGQRFATRVRATDPDDAERQAVAEASAELVVAAVLVGPVAVIA